MASLQIPTPTTVSNISNGRACEEMNRPEVMYQVDDRHWGNIYVSHLIMAKEESAPCIPMEV